MNALLGLPLDKAILRLEAEGIRPEVLISRAPRRPEGIGAFRVVHVADGGRRLTVCAFLTALKEEA